MGQTPRRSLWRSQKSSDHRRLLFWHCLTQLQRQSSQQMLPNTALECVLRYRSRLMMVSCKSRKRCLQSHSRWYVNLTVQRLLAIEHRLEGDQRTSVARRRMLTTCPLLPVRMAQHKEPAWTRPYSSVAAELSEQNGSGLLQCNSDCNETEPSGEVVYWSLRQHSEVPRESLPVC